MINSALHGAGSPGMECLESMAAAVSRGYLSAAFLSFTRLSCHSSYVADLAMQETLTAGLI